MDQEVRFITVEIHDSAWQAHVCRALLESENIPAYLRSEHHIGLQWPMSRVLGGVRVVVPAHLLHQAQSLLAERDNGTLEQALEHDYPSDVRVCKRCDGTEFRRKTPLSAALATFLMLWLWSTPFPPGKEYFCKQCGAMAP
ncbi:MULTISPECIES: DUF2007 domain-containing protein [Comamonas]|uniref:putative signal transducing protein n=1 Tax=Comamonas TaxID=283 RepID=UPI001402BC47|nr:MULTISPECIES: DUF2007 domain-containing protein [Comamonas]